MPVGKECTEQSILVNERKRCIDYVGELQGFWPIRAVERRSGDRCCIKPVGILPFVDLKMAPSHFKL
jgi:hypothetical protein